MTTRTDLPSTTAPNFSQRVRETLMTYLGRQGDPLDRGITIRDLVDAGIVRLKKGFTWSATSIPPIELQPQTDTPDLSPPPIPTGFKATGAISHVLIEHDAATYTQGHGHLRSRLFGLTVSGAITNVITLPTFASAKELAQFSGQIFALPSNPATTWRLWITWESVDGVQSLPAGGTHGIEARTGDDVQALLEVLQGSITETELFESLGQRIDLIDDPTSGLVKRVDGLLATYGDTTSSASNAALAASSASDAILAKTAALLAQGGAQTAKDEAVLAKTAAQSSQASAQTQASAASNAATSAAGSASEAATSAATASQAATNAGNSASSAATSASNASSYATSAETASSASTSAKVAAQSARDAAQVSASAAATSASTASTKASEAGQSAISASNAATQASTSEANAGTYKNQASVSATNAANSAAAAAQDYTAVTARLNSAGGAGVTVEQSLSASASSITGLKAQYTVKIDANGYVAGFGLASTAINGSTVSDFIVRADRFSIANPSGPALSPIVPFSVTTSAQTVNGVAVPAGVYIDSAFIKNGTITSAKIGDAAIDNAKIASLSAEKITAGTLSADRISSGSLDAKIANLSAAVITSGTINAARIGQASITTAKIAEAAIDTLRIKGNAVTIPVMASASQAVFVSLDMTLPVPSPVMLWMAMKWSAGIVGPLPSTDAGIGYSLNGVFTWLYRIPGYNPNTSQQLVCVAHFTPPANTLITFAGGGANGAYYDIILLAMGVMR